MQRIEKSGYRKNEYVGYANGAWRITKTNSTFGNWVARKQDNQSFYIFAMTLAQMDRKLEEWERENTRPIKNPVRDPSHKSLLRSLSKHFSSDEAALKRMTRRRKGPWPKGRTPPHLKKYLFK